jgi:acyl dehydratase
MHATESRLPPLAETTPPFERRSEPGAWNRFAAVNDEFVAIHMDDDAGRQAGFPSAFGMGNLQLAYLHAAVRQWMRDGDQLTAVTCRYRRPSLKNTQVVARGLVTGVTTAERETTIELEIWTEDEMGTRLSDGVARVRRRR